MDFRINGKQFTLTPTTKDGKVTGVNPIYAYSDILFTNTSSTPTSFSLSSEGLLAVERIMFMLQVQKVLMALK